LERQFFSNISIARHSKTRKKGSPFDLRVDEDGMPAVPQSAGRFFYVHSAMKPKRLDLARH
jgi:hypothetical protein